MKVSDASPDVQIASALSKRLSLVSISIPGLSAKLIGNVDGVVLDYTLEKVKVHWTVSEHVLSAFLPFVLVVHPENEENRRVAELSVMILARYKAFSDRGLPDRNELWHFAAISGYMHAWPYLRAEVQSLTAKIGLPSLTLPIIVSGHVPGRVAVSSTPLEVGLPSERVHSKARTSERRRAVRPTKDV